MGYRLHVATKYDVEFGGGWFNNSADEVTDFIVELCKDEDCFISEDGSMLEISKDALASGIERLREYETIELPVEIQDLGYSAEELVMILKEMLNRSEPRLDYIVMKWF